MNWTSIIGQATIWYDKTGTNNVTYYLRRIGPLFKVTAAGDKWFGASDELWAERWFFSYKSADAEFTRRVFATHEEIEWE